MKKFIYCALLMVCLCSCMSSGKVLAATARAVSLRVLQETVKAGTSKEAQSLCGITEISGFVVDNKMHDIILVGKLDPDMPSLHLEDFVVALRNAMMVYVHREGNTLYYSPPGCSIDPDPAVLSQLNGAYDKMSRISDPDLKRKAYSDCESIGSSPQKVRVLGIPMDSRFAKVMVDADYHMKRLVNGSVDPGIKGFRSLMDMRLDAVAKDRGRQVTSTGSLNRFWFYPGESTFEEDQGAILLKSCPVKLLTEEEFITSSGEVAGKGRPDAMAQQFTNSFTIHYQEIAAAKPIYKELEDLFRFTAITKLLKDRKALSSAGLNLDYLTKRYPVAKVPVNKTLPGLTSLKEFNDEWKSGNTIYTSTLWIMSCGGVSINISPERVALPKSKTNARRTTSIKSAVLASRKSKKALYWDVPDLSRK